MEKPRLIYIIHGISVGGAELALLSALPLLSTHFDFRLIVLGKSDSALMDKLNGQLKRKMMFWNFPTVLFPLYAPFAIFYISRFKPDIIISSLWRSIVLGLIYRSLRRVKYFVMMHSSGYFHKFDKFFTKKGMQYANAVFADSEASKVFASEFLGERKPVKVLSYLMVPTPKNIEKKQFDMKFNFYFMGSLNTIKRVPLAVKAVAWLRQQGVDASLHIYGRFGNDEKAVRTEIEKSGVSEAIKICGEVAPDEKSKVYPSHNCYVQLSAYEGMAMSVAEAMQQGMLCVLTPVGEIPNYAIDGKSAIFMDVTDGQLSEQSLGNLLSILKDKERCEALSSAAHARFKDAPLFAESLVDAIQES